MLNKKVRTYLFILLVVICIDLALTFDLENQERFRPGLQNDQNFIEELEYFPIPQSSGNSRLSVSFVDTWKTSRNYKEERFHEGCDIITSVDTPGIYPVISISDGVVEKMGWLELGGYRVGIRSISGLYVYYAHLQSYAPDLEVGDAVTAGECIGFVGDTGYGVEGTTGMFLTHLHIGFYLPGLDGDEPFNPYPYLVELQNKQLKYHYQEP